MQEALSKCPICGSTKGYEISGILDKYAKCPFCMAKWKILTSNKHILELVLHELPKDGKCLYTITSTKAPLFNIMGITLPISFWKTLQLDGETNWDFLSQNIDPNALKAVVLEKGEKMLHQWDGIRMTREQKVVSGNTVEVSGTETGVLLLSTRRMLWLQRHEEGFWRRVASFHVSHEILLEDIKGISGNTGNSDNWDFNTKVTVVDSGGENMFDLKHAFLELFRPMVEYAIETRRNEIEVEKKKERLHVMLDFSFLKNYMEKGGLIVQVLKCPECGASIEFPNVGTQTKCSYCGKVIYAQDIFEKMKNLLE